MGHLIVRGMRIDDTDTPLTNSVYAHGELEKIWGYDLVWIPKWGMLPKVNDGIYDAWFVLPNNEIVDAKIFIWLPKEWNYMKGLVVKVGDDDAMEYAEKAYNRKADTI